MDLEKGETLYYTGTGAAADVRRRAIQMYAM